MAVLTVDLGGSHIAVAVVDGSKILADDSHSTEAASLSRELDSIAAMARHCIQIGGLDASALQGIALGFCGVVDGETGAILSTLSKYRDAAAIDLHAWAWREFGLPLRMENDACLALLGEKLAGGAQTANDIVMITLGTGIGASAMLGGKPLRSRMGQAGCMGGHLPVNFRGRRCACGAVGCAEAEASTSVLPLLCREQPGFVTSILAREAKIDFETLFRAVDQHDRVACGVLAHCLAVWSSLTVGLIHAYGPELVLFGGGVLERGDQLLEPVRAYVAEHAWRTVRGLPRIERAVLGPRAALLGGAALFADWAGSMLHDGKDAALGLV